MFDPVWIAEWFQAQDDEFVEPRRSQAFSIVEPSAHDGRILYTTKPSQIADLLGARRGLRLGMIGRIGLPNAHDVQWLSELIASRKLLFLGDLDPPDLLVFAWLQGALPHTVVTHCGVNDTLLDALDISSTKAISMPLAPAEVRAIPMLTSGLDVSRVAGRRCLNLLQRGRKIELEAVACNPTHRRKLARWIADQAAA